MLLSSARTTTPPVLLGWSLLYIPLSSSLELSIILAKLARGELYSTTTHYYVALYVFSRKPKFGQSKSLFHFSPGRHSVSDWEFFFQFDASFLVSLGSIADPRFFNFERKPLLLCLFYDVLNYPVWFYPIC